MPFKRPDPPLEISWRTRELGPEARRRLFEQLVPSGRQDASGRKEPARDGPRPGSKEPKSVDRSKEARRPPKKKGS